MTTKGEGAIGALDWDEETRKTCAKKSKAWSCAVCGSVNATCLPDEIDAPVTKLECEPELSIHKSVEEDEKSGNLNEIVDTMTTDVNTNETVESSSSISPTSEIKIDESTRRRRVPLTRTVPEVLNPVNEQRSPLFMFVIALIGIIVLRRVLLLING